MLIRFYQAATQVTASSSNRTSLSSGRAPLIRLQTAARTVDDLWDAIAKGIDSFTPTECVNCFAAAGSDHG